MLEHRMQVQRIVGRVAVQIQGYTDDGDVRHHQGNSDQLPRGEVQETVKPHKISSKINQLRQGDTAEVFAGTRRGSYPATLAYTCTQQQPGLAPFLDRKSTRLNSSHVRISYAVFCLKK